MHAGNGSVRFSQREAEVKFHPPKCIGDIASVSTAATRSCLEQMIVYDSPSPSVQRRTELP